MQFNEIRDLIKFYAFRQHKIILTEDLENLNAFAIKSDRNTFIDSKTTKLTSPHVTEAGYVGHR